MLKGRLHQGSILSTEVAILFCTPPAVAMLNLGGSGAAKGGPGQTHGQYKQFFVGLSQAVVAEVVSGLLLSSFYSSNL